MKIYFQTVRAKSPSNAMRKFAGLTNADFKFFFSKFTTSRVPVSLCFPTSPSSPFRCDALTSPWKITAQPIAGTTRFHSTLYILSSSTCLGFVIGPWTTQICPEFSYRKAWNIRHSGKTRTLRTLHFSCSTSASIVILWSGPWIWRLMVATFVTSRSASIQWSYKIEFQHNVTQVLLFHVSSHQVYLGGTHTYLLFCCYISW